MRLRLTRLSGAVLRPCIVIAMLFALLLACGSAPAADPPIADPPAAAPAPASPPAMDSMMSSAGWLQQILVRLENEATSDIMMLPDTPGALGREWRSFAR